MNQLQTTNRQMTKDEQARAIVASKMDIIKTVTGGDKAKASAFAASLSAMASDKSLSACSAENIINTGLEIVRLGLNPNKTFGQAYVVPFVIKGKNGKPDFTVAQLQIGYKGWISLAYRNGWIFRALAAYKCDEFEINFAGIKDEITFNPNYDERDETDSGWVFNNLRGVMVYAKDGAGNEFSEFVSKKKLEQLRLKSQNQKDQNVLTNIWGEWAEEMYKAKAIKYVATRLPITEQIQEAINAENEAYRDEPKQIQNAPKIETTANLNDLVSSSEKPNSSVGAKNSQTEEAEFIEAAPIEVEIDVNADILPLDALQSELMNRGASEAEAEKLLERVSPDEAKAYLADPNSIDALMENLRR
jgi:recombinase, phage recT family